MNCLSQLNLQQWGDAMATLDETQRFKKDMTRLLEDAIADTQRTNASRKIEVSQRRRRFAIGMFLLSPFCLVVSGFSALHASATNGGIWGVFSIALLLVGGWQYDKATAEETVVRPKLVAVPHRIK